MALKKSKGLVLLYVSSSASVSPFCRNVCVAPSYSYSSSASTHGRTQVLYCIYILRGISIVFEV